LENFGPTEQIDVAEDMRTFLTVLAGYQFSGWRWTHVKLAPISAAGATIGTAATYTFTSPVAGATSTLVPPQIALAITMRANIVGRKGRGRIYVPAWGTGSLENNSTLKAATGTGLRNGMKALIDNVQNVAGFSTYLPIVVVTSAGATEAVRPVEVRTG
jgi:hypothetical protein